MAKDNKHTSAKQKKIPAKKDANVKKATHKRRVKGTSEVDNPKYANMDFMLSLVESAAKKEDERADKKLAKKAHVAKIIEEKDAKKDQKAEEKRAKLEKVKQEYLEAQRKKKNEAKKLKAKAKMEAARAKLQPAAPEKKKKSVRFA